MVQFTIDAQSGILAIGEVLLEPRQSISLIEPQIAFLVKSGIDHGNGYEWLYLHGLSFGGEPASMGLCFHHRRLDQMSWNVHFADAPDGWPSGETINREIAFVREVLAQSGLVLSAGSGTFAWGEVWSVYDPRAALGRNGLRYH